MPKKNVTKSYIAGLSGGPWEAMSKAERVERKIYPTVYIENETGNGAAVLTLPFGENGGYNYNDKLYRAMLRSTNKMTVHFLPPEGDAEVYSILQIKDHFTMTLKRGKHGPFSVLHKKRKWLID